MTLTSYRFRDGTRCCVVTAFRGHGACACPSVDGAPVTVPDRDVDWDTTQDECVAVEGGCWGTAQASGMVLLGDVLVAVDGRGVVDLHFDSVMSAVKQMSRPLRLGFRRWDMSLIS